MASRSAPSRPRTTLAILLTLAGLAVPASEARAQVGVMPREGRRVAVPAQVEAVLKAIDETGQAPPGHLGGGEYHNSGRRGEQILPRVDREGDPIAYRTWDVHRAAPGGRGAERLVTGSDGSAYYTPDDYKTFATVRNPARSTHDGPDHARAPTTPPPGREPHRTAPSNRNAPAPGTRPSRSTRRRPLGSSPSSIMLAHEAPPPEHVGGREYRNLGLDGGAVLPRTDDRGRPIRYREWDVNRKVAGRNRGAERLVTGSDGHAYYTEDHYNTFRRVRSARKARRPRWTSTKAPAA